MSSDWERGYTAGYDAGMAAMIRAQIRIDNEPSMASVASSHGLFDIEPKKTKKRKKLSAYNRFVKECAKKPRFRYKSGKKKNMLNMRAIGQAWRKKRK
jgi:hypothetical protein